MSASIFSQRIPCANGERRSTAENREIPENEEKGSKEVRKQGSEEQGGDKAA
jgi:hypothetical protein